jgi:hypothetical protein
MRIFKLPMEYSSKGPLLAEKRFLQASKGAENTKKKNSESKNEPNHHNKLPFLQI